MTRKTHHFDARSRQSAISEASLSVIVRCCLENLAPFLVPFRRNNFPLLSAMDLIILISPSGYQAISIIILTRRIG